MGSSRRERVSLLEPNFLERKKNALLVVYFYQQKNKKQLKIKKIK